jgi:hypothetical protein
MNTTVSANGKANIENAPVIIGFMPSSKIGSILYNLKFGIDKSDSKNKTKIRNITNSSLHLPSTSIPSFTPQAHKAIKKNEGTNFGVSGKAMILINSLKLYSTKLPRCRANQIYKMLIILPKNLPKIIVDISNISFPGNMEIILQYTSIIGMDKSNAKITAIQVSFFAAPLVPTIKVLPNINKSTRLTACLFEIISLFIVISPKLLF